MSIPWTLRHLDCRNEDPCLAASGTPVCAVFWWGELPLGARVFMPGELPVSRDQLIAVVADLVADQLTARLTDLGATPRRVQDGHPILAPRLEAALALDDPLGVLDRIAAPAEVAAGDMSVIVCTRDGPVALAACLAALGGQRHPPGEIIVVDNSATRSGENVCREQPGVVFCHEPRAGLSIARNAGLAHSTRELVAFAGGDVEPHRGWTAELVRAFSSPDVEAVTGLVLPDALDADAERVVLSRRGAVGGCLVPMRFERRLFDVTAREGVPVWRMGAESSMAFRRSAFERLGSFDERLGSGAAGGSGEASEMWYRILAGGGTCLHEPRAIVYRRHRDGLMSLRRRARGNLTGEVAALVAQYDRHGHGANLRRIGAQIPRDFIRSSWQCLKNGRSGELLLQEVLGWASGLRYLAKPAWRADGRSMLDHLGGAGADAAPDGSTDPPNGQPDH